MKCEKCGFENPQGVDFCLNCGASINKENQPISTETNENQNIQKPKAESKNIQNQQNKVSGKFQDKKIIYIAILAVIIIAFVFLLSNKKGGINKDFENLINQGYNVSKYFNYDDRKIKVLEKEGETSFYFVTEQNKKVQSIKKFDYPQELYEQPGNYIDFNLGKLDDSSSYYMEIPVRQANYKLAWDNFASTDYFFVKIHDESIGELVKIPIQEPFIMRDMGSSGLFIGFPGDGSKEVGRLQTSREYIKATCEDKNMDKRMEFSKSPNGIDILQFHFKVRYNYYKFGFVVSYRFTGDSFVVETAQGNNNF